MEDETSSSEKLTDEKACKCGSSGSCESVVNQYQDVKVAVKLNTFAKVGDTTTQCCGDPKVSINCYKDGCGRVCHEVIVMRTIVTRIPIEYYSCANVGETKVDCKGSDDPCERKE